MKTKKILFLLLTVALFAGFTSCGDDDEQSVDNAKEITGSYEGSFTIPSIENPFPGEIDVTRLSNEKVNVTVKEVPVLKIPVNCPCTVIKDSKSGKYLLEGKLEMTQPKAITLNLSGSVDSTKTLILNMAGTIDGSQLAVSFEGVRK